MRKLLLLALLLFSIGLESYTCWEENGKAIRQVTQMSYSSKVISLSGGGYMMMWSDASSGIKEMKILKVSATGEPEWDTPLILSNRDCYNPNNESLVETSDGDIVTAWTELTDYVQLRVQRIDTEGNLQWGESGYVYEVAEPYQNFSSPPQTISDEIGGVYLAWSSWSNPHAIEAIYLDEDGNPGTGWSSNGNTILSINSSTWEFSVIPDGIGGMITLLELSDDIFLQRCDNQANLLWGEEGISINELYSDSEIYLLPWDTEEYAIIVEQNDEILVNIINSDGEFSFDEPQSAANIRDGYTTDIMQVVKTSDGRLGIIYDEAEGYISNINVQKTEIGVGTEWGEYGIEIGSTDNSYPPEFNIAADDTGGMAICWSSYINGSDYNIYYQHCDEDGNLLTGDDPVLVNSIPHRDNSFKIFSSGENSVLFWNRYREDRDEIAIQIYNSNEIPQLDEPDNVLWSVLAGGADYQNGPIVKGGITAICWNESRYYQNQIYIQAINNETGDFLYAENGISAIEISGYNENYGKLCIDENGENIGVTFRVNTGTTNYGIVQILDQEGNRLLGNDGMIFCEEYGILENEIACIGENEYLIVWSACRDWTDPEKYMKAQKIVDEQFVWGDGVTLMAEDEHVFEGILLQYPYVSWYEQDIPDIDLKLARITDDGSLAPSWGPDGLLISENYRGGTSQIYADDDGVYIFWEERIDIDICQLRGQKYSPDGELQWEEGGRVFRESSEYFCGCQLKDDYLYYIIHETGVYYTLYKCNLSGESIWENGITFENSNGCLFQSFNIWEDIIVVYIATANSSIYPMNNDIYALIYDTDGNLVENVPPEGLEVCIEPHYQSILECTCGENGSSILLWKDGRGEFFPGGDNSLYVQKINLTAAPVSEAEIPDGSQVNMSNYPNPFMESTVLKCDLPRGEEEAEIVIYNIRGQKVRSLPATRSEVIWDCRNDDGKLAGAGIYFYRLKGEDIESKTGKMIMLR